MLFTKSIKYPNTFSYVSGQTELDDTTVSINRCLGLLLTTAKGELLGDPDFGCRLYEMLFDQYSNTLVDLIKQDIVENVKRYETRITLTEDGIDISENDNSIRNSYKIKLNYTIKNNYQPKETEIILEERVAL